MPHDNARRGFLRHSIAIVPVAALSSAGCTQQTPTASAVPPPAEATAAPSTPYSPSFFSAPEWAFVQAAVARLIPADDTVPGAIEAGVPEFIDRQMDAAFGHAALWYMQGPFVESPPEFGYQGKLPPRDVYRAGIEACDAYCKRTFEGKAFAQLDTGQQDQVLKGLESGEVALDGISATTFFGFLLQNTKEGYLSDPIHGGNKNAAAWKMIGFPGARADFADWVGRPGVAYPLPPVSISGPQG
ncbi:gluconate 2-dehydrogenase subunit 3 family protein [Xylophilus sp. ASV27]|uniref:gluconate 2-dehydrogenase subunit 3 family protein n=1 Tax=Xylophilus sp. ASV27 TaxID=2795129 RepID=UPI0018EE25AF|nr:gluconate 2-dehydrogenase subunit 3 family protein [Xylophilus sp. ASV27]